MDTTLASPFVAVDPKGIPILCSCRVPCTMNAQHRPVNRPKIVFTPIPLSISSHRNVLRWPVGRISGGCGSRPHQGWPCTTECICQLLEAIVKWSLVRFWCATERCLENTLIKTWTEEMVWWVKCLSLKHGDQS